ncbi:Integrase [Janthinobacterium sp. CG23_2]|nr:Integrase [Janthinobacterium sp. CG23_2]CUU27706.1 Integrase [Janthinobacterium sp. CG23_2]
MSIRYLRDKKRYRFEFEAQINGQRVRATKMLPEAWTKKQADDFDKAECARLYAEEAGIQRPRVTIDQAVIVYMDEKCPTLKNGRGVVDELDRFKDAYMGRNIEELPEVAKEYAELKAGVLAPATIRNRLAYLRAACRYGYRFHSMGERDPAERMQMPTVKNERHHYASRAEMLRIARKISPGPGRAVVRIAFYSGMRLSEVLAAKLVGCQCFLLEDTKNGDRRMIPIHPRLLCCLGYYPISIKKRWVQRQFTIAAAALGLEHLHFHDLRHSAASEMINSGATLYEVGAVLGHRSAQSTKRYAHLATDTLAAAVGLIGRRTKK